MYDYLKLLYARVGRTYSPVSGEEVKRYTADDICRYVLQEEAGTTAFIMARPKNMDKENLDLLLSQGFSRVKYGDEFLRISDLSASKTKLDPSKELYLVIDRIRVSDDKDTSSRLTDSVETALYEGDGVCYIELNGKIHSFSNRFEADGLTFQVPDINMFSFNSPIGACPKCEGYGRVLGIDEDLVIPNKSLSVYDDAVMCWRGEIMSEWKRYFIQGAHRVNFPVHTP